MLSTIYYNKHIEKHNQKIKYNRLITIQKKLFYYYNALIEYLF